jgi:hypothetical protein
MTHARPRSALADVVMERLVSSYPPAADADRAAQAAAYMKGVRPFSASRWYVSRPDAALPERPPAGP